MTCEHLICAQCASPVVEGRCPVCKAARAQVHHSSAGHNLPLVTLALIALLMLLLALQLAR